MKKKSDNNVENKSGSFSMKNYKPPVVKKEEIPEDTLQDKRGMTRATKIIIISVAAALLIAAIWLTVYFVIDSYNKNFDYIEYDLSGYIDLSEDKYKGYTLELDIARPHKKNPDGTGVSDVEIAVLRVLSQDVGGKTIGALSADPTEIAVGDDVYFWYRAYIIDDGKEVDITGLSNFYKTESSITADSNAITVGEGAFSLAGLEGGLVGINTGDYAKFKKITEGTVKAGQVAYISCERIPTGGTDADKQAGTSVRIDLSDAETAAIWNPVLLGKTVGENVDDFRVTLDGVEYNYSKTKVEFVTECESAENVLTIETYAPYDHTVAQIRNETLYVDVYVERVQKRNDWHNLGESEYTVAYDWNDAYIRGRLDKDTLGIDEETLNSYEGATLVEKYESYVEKTLEDNYLENLKQMTEDEMWDYYLETAEVKKYPQIKVDEIYREYYNDLLYQFNSSGGVIYNYLSGSNETCETIDDYAKIYFRLQYAENQSYEDYLQRLAESLVKERLILYYLMKKENITPTQSELTAKISELKDEYLDEYVKQDSTDTSEYTEDEYNEYLDECRQKISDYYDDAYFAETAYYEIVVEDLLRYPGKILTLNDFSAYEKSKS